MIKSRVVSTTSCSCYKQCLEREWIIIFGITTSRESAFELKRVFAVHTADAVATGEVNCYNVIVRLRSLPRFAETTRQGYCSAEQRPLACEDGSDFCCRVLFFTRKMEGVLRVSWCERNITYITLYPPTDCITHSCSIFPPMQPCSVFIRCINTTRFITSLSGQQCTHVVVTTKLLSTS